jgi:uncharacterized protein (DUF2236 family)
LLDGLLYPARRSIAGRVSSIFGDEAAPAQPVPRCVDGLFGAGSITWRVHGDAASMMIGGVGALLLQMLHPSVLAGVWDHSNFRADMRGRLRRTARFVAVTTFGGRGEAVDAIEHVRRIHDRVRGTLPDGTPYAANDPELLDWVNLSGASSFLAAYRRYRDPLMTRADQDRYYDEMAQVALLLGAGDPPRTCRAAAEMTAAMRPRLKADARSHEVARLVLRQPADRAATEPIRQLVMAAGVDLLPRWARRMHGLRSPVVMRPGVRLGTLGVAQAVRWAFAAPDGSRDP